MRFAPFVFLAAVVIAAGGCGSRDQQTGEVLYRHHFAGLSAVGSHADLGRVREVLALPESQAVLRQVSRRLAVVLPTWFGKAPLGTNDALVYEPFVRALLDTESYVEVVGRDGRVTGWGIAARVPASAGPLGSGGGTFSRLLGVAAGPVEQAAFRVAGAAGLGAAEVALEGGWLLVGAGDVGVSKFRDSLKSSGRPGNGFSNEVLEAHVDLKRLAALAGLREKPPGPVDQWPSAHLQVAPKNGQFRTTATLRFEKDLGLSHDAWQVPTNLLRDPLIGFTAARGAGTWLGRLGIFSDLGVTRWPDQLFLWSMAGDPWLQYFAAPIEAPTNLMAEISLTLPVRAVTNMLWSESVFSLRITNQSRRVELRGLPYFAPFMEAVKTGSGEQLFGGLFPGSSAGRPVPPGLVQQVAGRTNLVLYDWETTGRRLLMTNAPGSSGAPVTTNDIGRLIHFRHLTQFAKLMLLKDPMRLPTGKTGELLIPGSDWMDAAQPLLRDTVTEVSQTGPRELSAVRSSVTGFNALELIYLLRWIENPGFPGWVEPVVPAASARRSRPPVPGAAAPDAPASVPASAPGVGSKLPPPVKAPGTP